MKKKYNVHPLWTKGIKDPKEKEDFEYYVANSRTLLLKLNEMLDDKFAELMRGEANEDYSSPSWACLQADRIGQVKTLQFLKRIIEGSLNNAE